MFLRTETFDDSYFAGKNCTMSLADNKTFELWQSFMPARKNIPAADMNLYSFEIYPQHFFDKFDIHRSFIKWAASKVNDPFTIPGFELLKVPKGLYAVFLHKGTAAGASNTYHYIYNEWIPQSLYLIDDRPHFAVMGKNYNNNSSDSEEEIFIPVLEK